MLDLPSSLSAPAASVLTGEFPILATQPGGTDPVEPTFLYSFRWDAQDYEVF